MNSSPGNKSEISCQTFTTDPLIFDTANSDDQARLASLRARGAIWNEHDTLQEQLDGLLESRQPALRTLNATARAELIESARIEYLGSRRIEDYGRWVLYPWSGQLVHLLPPAEYDELRLDRNRNKVTRQEQVRLRQMTVGVVGLSVGNAVALNLALEGACGHLVLADFDELELSNMNRIRAATHSLGLPKVVLAARQLAELDPYLSITLFPAGLDEDNLDDFFRGPASLDIVVDECDSIAMKFFLREKARSLKLPVLMETSDRSLLDVERFDLEPERPLFHGRVGEQPASSFRSLTADDKMRYVLKIVGSDVMSPSMAASLLEVEHTISTWPQLGSDVMLGGASVTQAVRRIALGHPLPSGRRVIDLAAGLDRIEEPAPPQKRSPLPRTLLPRKLLGTLIEELLSEAILAPSGGNAQPWHFEVDGCCLFVCLNHHRNTGLLDVGHTASFLALGAVIDILAIGAAARERQARIQLCPIAARPEVVARVDIVAPTNTDNSSLAKLHPLVAARHTNRQVAPSNPLTSVERQSINDAVDSFGTRLDWIEEPCSLKALGKILGQGDRVRVLHSGLNADLKRELAFESAAEVLDAISIDTVEASELDRIAYQFMIRPEVASRVRQTGGGERLTDRSRIEIETAAAVGILTSDSESPESLLSAGRAMHRAWLEATRLGLGFQPVGALPYMLRMMQSPEDGLFDKDEERQLQKLAGELQRLHPVLLKRSPLMLFRVHRAPPASARSLRIPLEAVITMMGKDKA